MEKRKLHINLFGKFHLENDGEPAVEIKTARIQELLAYLLLNRDTPQSRQYLSFQFWPESTEKQARTNLRNLLYKLRNLVPDPNHYLLTDNKTIRWNAEAEYLLDIAEFESAVERARRAGARGDTLTQKSALTRAANLYKDDLLVTCYQDWIEPERKQFQKKYVQVLRALVEILDAERAYHTAIFYAKKLIKKDPYNEAGYRKLMKFHALNKNRAKAIQVYKNCAALLNKELDIKPSQQTTELYESLKSDTFLLNDKKDSSEREWSLVGRRKEWQKLLKTWKKVLSEKSPHFVILKGESGIGKSRLGQELQDYIGRQGYQIINARAYASAESVSFGLIADCLNNESVITKIKKMDTVWHEELSRLLPELKVAFPDLPDPEPIKEAWERKRFFEAIMKALTQDDKPKLLFFDDLQWCDSATLEWLDYLFHHAASARLLITGTVRTGEAIENEALQQFLSNLNIKENATEIVLTALDKFETGALAKLVLGKAINSDLEQFLFKEAEGNPLFIIEYLRDKQYRNHLDKRLSANNNQAEEFAYLPKKISKIITARFQHLSGETGKLMNLSAAIGREFSFEILKQASGLEDKKLIDLLDELLRYHIIREKESGIFDFTHDKLREIAYSEMSETRTQWCHRRIAEAMETVYAGSRKGYYGQLALHFKKAGELEKSISFYEKAAREARSLFSDQDVAFYKKALALLEQLPEGEQRDRKEQKLLTGLGTSLGHFKEVNVEKIIEVGKRVLALSEKLDESPSASVLYTLARGNIFSAKLSDAERIGRKMQMMAEKTDDPVLCVETNYILSFLEFLKGNSPKSQEYLEEGLDKYDVKQRSFFIQHNGQDTGMLLKAGLVLVLLMRGYTEDSKQLLKELEKMGENSSDPYTVAYNHYYLKVTCAHLQGETEKTKKAARELISFASEFEYSFWHATGNVFAGWALVQEGDIKEGMALMKKGMEAMEKQNILLKIPYYKALFAEALSKNDEIKEAFTLIEKAMRLAQETEQARMLAEIYRIQGELYLRKDPSDIKSAKTVFNKAIKIARQQDAKLFEDRARTALEQLG